MPSFLFHDFIVLDLWTAIRVALLGFIGGVLSGFSPEIPTGVPPPMRSS